MEAIKKKHQKSVNKAVKFLTAYNTANDQRNNADDSGDTKMYKKYDKICEVKFNNYLEICASLPAREVKNIEKNLY